MKNLAIATVAGLALAATSNAQVIDISGGGPSGGAPNVLGMAVSGGVTAIAFNLSYTTFTPSWGEEANIDIAGPGGFLFTADGGDGGLSDDGPDDLTFGWGGSSGTFTFVGTVAVSGGAGTYTVSSFDDFDDFGGGDNGIFNSGSTITLIPAPGAAALLGMGGLAATRRRR